MEQRTRVAAYGLILKETRLVLCRISPDVGCAGQWTLPGGGLDFGEDPQNGVVREVKEETGLDVRPTNVAGIDSVRIQADGVEHHGIRIVYEVELLGGELRNEKDGSTDLCQWFNKEEANQLKLVDLAVYGLQKAFA